MILSGAVIIHQGMLACHLIHSYTPFRCLLVGPGGGSTGCSSPKGVLLLEIVQLTAVQGPQSLCHSPEQLWPKYATFK
ncbi:hypothetical protein F751_2241 [Auxenochlorella protothecoides]|uniref:Uncharacterized protein n=1 Tax=Auxenochlorella protothecoides TaxID=3075 RepID=A0A087SLQ0_AUXPR|nr:hypothetical protein F751_2241 [Auxenochlorella protothecoides]KFM26654.1 hypothetical protein F751_2241 [Auxenochlorella protothecoides]